MSIRPCWKRAAARGASLALVLAAGLAAIAAGDDHNVKSEWSKAPPVIDGNLDDWAGELTYWPDDDVTVGIRNDDDFLYVALSFDDPRLGMRAMMNGLTVWLQGEHGARLGIKFPLSRRERGAPGEGAPPPDSSMTGPPAPPPAGGETAARPPRGERGDRSGRPAENGRRGGAFRDPERMRALLERASQELDLLDAQGAARRLATDRAAKEDGIAVALDEQHRILTYELKVPLHAGKGRATALDAARGDALGWLVESEAMEPRERDGERRPEFGPPGGGAGGYPGVGPRDGTFGGGFERSDRPEGGRRWDEPFKLEATIKIAGPTK